MSNTVSIVQSAKRSGPVTPNDNTELNFKRLYVGGTGNVVIRHGVGNNEAAVTYSAVPAGTFIDAEGVRVMAASTATLMVWMDW